MVSAMAILSLPKLSPITDNIAIILKILSVIAIKNCTDNDNPSSSTSIDNNFYFLFIVSILLTSLTHHYTVRPLLSADLDYPRFLEPKFGTPNLNEVQ